MLAGAEMFHIAALKSHPGLLPSARIQTVGFLRQLPDYPNDRNYTYFEAQFRSLYPRYTQLRTFPPLRD